MLNAAAISSDGTRVATAWGSWRTKGGSVVLVEKLNGSAEIIGRLEDLADDVTGLAFSDDGRCLIACDRNGTLLHWDLETKDLIYHFGPTAFCACDISCDGRTVVAGDSNGFVHLLRLENSQPRPVT